MSDLVASAVEIGHQAFVAFHPSSVSLLHSSLTAPETELPQQHHKQDENSEHTRRLSNP